MRSDNKTKPQIPSYTTKLKLNLHSSSCTYMHFEDWTTLKCSQTPKRREQKTICLVALGFTFCRSVWHNSCFKTKQDSWANSWASHLWVQTAWGISQGIESKLHLFWPKQSKGEWYNRGSVFWKWEPKGSRRWWLCNLEAFRTPLIHGWGQGFPN